MHYLDQIENTRNFSKIGKFIHLYLDDSIETTYIQRNIWHINTSIEAATFASDHHLF